MSGIVTHLALHAFAMRHALTWFRNSFLSSCEENRRRRVGPSTYLRRLDMVGNILMLVLHLANRMFVPSTSNTHSKSPSGENKATINNRLEIKDTESIQFQRCQKNAWHP